MRYAWGALGHSPTDRASGHRYCAFFCEENVWHLCADPSVPPGPRAAVFVSNPGRAVAVAHQRVAVVPGFPIVWDYHVVMAVRVATEDWRIWDLDSSLPLGIGARPWLDASFGGAAGFGEDYAPWFRVVDGATYRGALSSDRGHMRDADGQYQAPPPAWPAIGQGPPNLMRFVHMQPGFLGEVVGLGALLGALDRSAEV